MAEWRSEIGKTWYICDGLTIGTTMYETRQSKRCGFRNVDLGSLGCLQGQWDFDFVWLRIPLSYNKMSFSRVVALIS